MSRAQNRGMETYPPYDAYLAQSTHWPRENDSGELEYTTIGLMDARHAASALLKMVRWSRTPAAAMALNIMDSEDREKHVRNTELGKALTARCQGLPTDTVRQQPEPISERGLFLLLFTELARIEKDAAIPLIAEQADLIAESLTSRGYRVYGDDPTRHT